MCGNNATMNHSWCCCSAMSKLTISKRILILWLNSHTICIGFCFISFSSVIHCDSNLGFLNSLINTVLTCTRVLAYLLEYFINQFNALSLNVVVNYAILISLFWTYMTFHIASHKNQCCSGSSNPVPLNIGSLISSSIMFLWVGCVYWTEGFPWLLGGVWLLLPLCNGTVGFPCFPRVLCSVVGLTGISPTSSPLVMGGLHLALLLLLGRCSRECSSRSTLYLFPPHR